MFWGAAMDTAEFIVTALSVGKVASLRDPGDSAVNDSYDRFQGVVATKIGEDAGRLLFEALAGVPDTDVEWLKRFVETIGMADEPLINTAALNAVGAILVWVATSQPTEASLQLGDQFQISRDASDGSFAITGSQQPLTLDPTGHFTIHDPLAGALSTRLVALSPGSLDDLAAILRTILTASLLPGEPGHPPTFQIR